MAPIDAAFFFLVLVGLGGSLAAGKAQVPAMFVFGDSLVDPGNNNNLLTLARANFDPNGIDFPVGETGRFCNGGTLIDHLGDRLGLTLIPPFNDPATNGSIILRGVNYASAGSGILNDTGEIFGNIFTMDQQIQNFNTTIQQIRSLLAGRTHDHFQRSLFAVITGSNDYINNYLLPISTTSSQYTPERFADLLVRRLGTQLKALYELGARKFFVPGLGPLGCIPNQIAFRGNDSKSCVTSTNNLVSLHNAKLKVMIREHGKRLTGSTFLYWDSYSFAFDVIANPASHGFKYQNTACCGAGRSKGQIICLSIIAPCENRSEYVFWDPYHPTDAFNFIAAKEAYQGNLQDSLPRNVKELVER
ncbi:GDSL esterase/lipase [Platanthera guangdongensis]|uniref:GDSL esterase/lipase n=1 Tax=Platanthera guangdongensis TaxID=2320717 RepID=A0ABR2LND1_9ASPA